MPSIRAPAARTTTTLTVAVKCRPLMQKESGRNIVRVNNSKEVIVLDPELSKDYLDRIQNRTKEKNYTFDHAFCPGATNKDVYRRSISSVISGVVHGLNATVFAYGSTGSGKTYTMVGTQEDPGLMVLSLNTIFDMIKKDESSDDFEVSCSYLEVYNEVIYDLLEKSSGHLELREDPDQGIVVAGLKSIKVKTADKILELLNLGNSRRKTDSTEVNATSSRSHAVLEITVKRRQRNQNQVMRGKLALVDLAGSERASETNSGGRKLRDGANINRSLLALANCINALGKQHKKGLAYVPYRNSKLTRILKDGLSGNSQTVMVATISPADSQYHHTVNTLKYADRAKEIKTHIQKNIGTIDSHVSGYQQMIDSLQMEVCQLRKELAEKELQLSIKPAERGVPVELSWLESLSHEISENVQERINLQKALFELEETNLRNRTELQHLDDVITKQIKIWARLLEFKEKWKNKDEKAVEKDGTVVEALRARRQVILDNIRDNDEAGVNYHKEIEENEKQRCKLQDMLGEAINNNGNKTYLRILSQYKLLGMANTELQLEMAMRDQIIYNQREAHRNLWNLLLGLGLGKKQILDLAAKQGITIEDWRMIPYPGFSYTKQPPGPAYGRSIPFVNAPVLSHTFSGSTYSFQRYENYGSATVSKEHWEPALGFCREEHHSSYYVRRQNPASAIVDLRKSCDSWEGSRPRSWFKTPINFQNLRNSFPQINPSNQIIRPNVPSNFYRQQKKYGSPHRRAANSRSPRGSPHAKMSSGQLWKESPRTGTNNCLRSRGSPGARTNGGEQLLGSPRNGMSRSRTSYGSGSPAWINSSPLSYGSPRARMSNDQLPYVSPPTGMGTNELSHGSPGARMSRDGHTSRNPLIRSGEDWERT